MSIRSACRCRCRRISRCRRAACTSAGRDRDGRLEQERRLHGPKLRGGAAPSRAPTPRPRGDRHRRSRGSASSPPARPISMCGRRWPTSASPSATPPRSGIRVYKVALTWPLEPSGARRFAEGLAGRAGRRGEARLHRGPAGAASLQYRAPRAAERRRQDATRRGATLLPSDGELTPTMVARAVVARLRRLGADSPAFEQRLARLEAFEQPAAPRRRSLQRTPYFCSGCPHNTSTRVPEGSRAMAGIGCHGMALFMPGRRHRDDHAYGRRGRELDRPGAVHQRSITSSRISATAPIPIRGLLAIRAAAAAGVNITYKILYNDAVAMTGGQPVEGGLTVPQIAQQVLAEGAKRVVVVADEPEKYPAQSGLPPGVDRPSPRRTRCRAARTARHRGPHRADLRPDLRRRKAPPPQARHSIPIRPKRVFINELVCEGCGDCSAEIELRLGAAARNRIRPQAPDRPVELQQGLFLPQGLLPELRHRARRDAAQARRHSQRPTALFARSAGAEPRRRSTGPTASSSPASAAPASSRSARCSAWPRISRARAAPCSTSPGWRKRTAR